MSIAEELTARQLLARKRLINILTRHGVANARMLEQKISDAGPFDQRIDPHVLTPERNFLLNNGRIVKITRSAAPWFYLPSTPRNTIEERLAEQLSIFQRLHRGNFVMRVGQCLEISIYRSLLRQSALAYLGSFRNLEEHDDSRLYSKEEPPQTLSGKHLIGDQKLDFVVHHPEAGWVGIESKNIREWLYPNRAEIISLLGKAVRLDCVPVLIARRIPFVTFKILSTCGVMFHQTYTQLLPKADQVLAEKAKHKDLLGYHDIRVGNQPDDRLVKFFAVNLPQALPEARVRFNEYKDLLAKFAGGIITYKEFAGRVRRRSEGIYEEGDWDPPDDYS